MTHETVGFITSLQFVFHHPPFCLASTSTGGVPGVRCSSGGLHTKEKTPSEATVTTSIYLHSPVAKTLAVSIQQAIALSLNQ